MTTAADPSRRCMCVGRIQEVAEIARVSLGVTILTQQRRLVMRWNSS